LLSSNRGKTMSRITVERRLEIEDAVIVHAMNECMKAGWYLMAVHDGEETHKLSSMLEALEITRSVDESWVSFYKFDRDGHKKNGRMFIVRGNDGPDVIADNTMNFGFDEVMNEVMEWASQRFDAEVYGA
jgi:hypothetical protein